MITLHQTLKRLDKLQAPLAQVSQPEPEPVRLVILKGLSFEGINEATKNQIIVKIIRGVSMADL
jgi:hypothetical protein